MKTVYPLQTKFAGGKKINKFYSLIGNKQIAKLSHSEDLDEIGQTVAFRQFLHLAVHQLFNSHLWPLKS